MNFNVRDVRETDVPEIFRWFNDRKWPMPAVPNVGPKSGMLAEKNGVLYACVYSYLTGTSAAYLEWPATNPDVPLEQAMNAFDEIIHHYKKMCEVSPEPKIRVLCLMTQSTPLAERFKKHGFKVTSDYHKVVWTLKS